MKHFIYSIFIAQTKFPLEFNSEYKTNKIKNVPTFSVLVKYLKAFFLIINNNSFKKPNCTN